MSGCIRAPRYFGPHPRHSIRRSKKTMPQRGARQKATSGKEIVRKIKGRLQQRIEGEHEKAKQAKQLSHEESPMSTFQKHWITTGAAVFTVHGPKVALLGPSPNKEPPLSEGVHLRTVAAVEPAAGRRHGGTSHQHGWCRRVTSTQTGARRPDYRPPGRCPRWRRWAARPRRARLPNTRSSRPTRRPYGQPWGTRARVCRGAAG